MHDCHAVVCLVSGFTGSAGVLWNWKSSCHIPHVAHTLDVLRPSRETSDFSAWFTTVLPSVILSPYSDSQSLMLQSKSGSSACGKWITHNCINVDFCFFIFFFTDLQVILPKTSLSISCFQPGVCNSSVLRPLPTKKVPTATSLSLERGVYTCMCSVISNERKLQKKKKKSRLTISL